MSAALSQAIEIDTLNPRLAKSFSLNRFTKGGGRWLSPDCELENETPDMSNWYHSIAIGLLFL